MVKELSDAERRFPKSERETQSEIQRYLDLTGIRYTVIAHGDPKRNWGFKAKRGWPDLVGCIPPRGRLLAIEVKAAKGRLSQEQEAELAYLRAAGALVILAKSVEDVARAITAETGA
jgi:hypothetical protein